MSGLFGGRPETQSSQTVSAPQLPAYLQPYETDAATQAQSLYNSGGLAPAYYSGQTVAPLSGQTQGGIDAITARATAGNPLLPAAQGASMDTINGNYLNADSNPYLQSAMDAANRGTVQQFSEATLPGLQASFSKAGRSSSDAYGNTIGRATDGLARTLSDSNSTMAANNYATERANQLNQINGAPALTEADYTDPSKLLSAGSLVDTQNQSLLDASQAKYDYNANLPYNALQNYLNLLNGTAGAVGNGSTTNSATYGAQTRTQRHHRQCATVGGALRLMGILDLLTQQTSPQGILSGGFGSQPPPQGQAPFSLFGLSDPSKIAFAQLSNVVGNWGQTPEQVANANAKNAEAAAASQKNNMPFGGDGFDNQLVRLRAGEYMKSGKTAPEAFSLAANDVLQTKQTPTADPNNPGAFLMAPRNGLPPIQGSAPAGQTGAPVAPLPVSPQSGLMTIPGPQGEPAQVSGAALNGGTLAPPATHSSFNPANQNPYAETGTVLQAGAKAGAEEMARRQAQKEANGGVPTFSQSEGQAASRSSLMKGALEGFEQVMNSPNISPGKMAVADTVGGMGPVGAYAADKIRSPDEQRFNVNKAGALESMASAVTGAGVTKEQFDRIHDHASYGERRSEREKREARQCL